MTTDDKIEEVLRIVREERERNSIRFDQLESRDNELLKMMTEERALNNARFTQLATGLSDVRMEVRDIRKDMKTGLAAVDAKIDRVYDSLSQDIQAFTQDLIHIKRKVVRLEKKHPS